MPDERDKGSFSADISADAVAEALKSVEQHTGEEIAVPPGEPQDDPLVAELRQKDALLEESARRSREMMERLKEANERMLRAAADLENYKKRAQKEKEEVQRFGVERLLRELLPVLDNFDRAIQHGETGGDLKSFTQGVGMTRKLFEDTLGKFGVKGFTATGQIFDPRLHEAIQQVEKPDVPAGTVLNEVVRGYTLHDRLVRPAMVVVSSGGPPPAPAAGGDGGEAAAGGSSEPAAS